MTGPDTPAAGEGARRVAAERDDARVVDPPWGRDVVTRLARRYVATAGDLESVDESGGEARAYIFTDLVVKTQRPSRRRARTSLAKEAFLLEEFARQGVERVPRLLGHGTLDDVEYEVMTRVAGVALVEASLSDAQRSRALSDAALTLRRIHEMDQSAMATSGVVPGDEGPGALARRVASTFDELLEGLASGPLECAHLDLAAVRATCLARLPAPVTTVTLHANPGVEHCFVDPGTGSFTGLIDFADAYRSHPALDVKSKSSLADSRAMLAGYASVGDLAPGFVEVWTTGLVLNELRLTLKGRRDGERCALAIEELLTH